jgi:RNA polymerase sigma factor (sigma-70 family)
VSSDKRLAQRAAEGDEHAFAEIYERYHQELYRFCVAMVGNPQDAQDALQNVMVKALRALPGEKREIELKPWLYRIARNESIEVLRRRRDSAELEQHEPAVGGVVETVDVRERLRTLLADLEQLPERQRAALLLRELAGLDFEEIGAAFESSAAVARQTLYEARLSLRQLETGREMVCADVTRVLSDADGRVIRRRDIGAHLRNCADCRAFQANIAKRHEDLAALAPLPLAASASLLHGLLGEAGATGAGTAGGGSLAGTAGAGAGKAVATAAIVKSAAAVAVVALVGVSAAGRSGLIEIPLASSGGSPATQRATESQAAPEAARAGRARAGGGLAVDGGASRGRRLDRTGAGNRRAGGGPGPGKRGPAESTGIGGEGPSRSQAGLSPPGGGYGRSASEHRGRPNQTPAAAARGQQNATAHKPSEAGAPSGRGTTGEAHSRSPERADPHPIDPPTPGEPAAAADPPSPQAPDEGASQGKGRAAEADAATPEREG